MEMILETIREFDVLIMIALMLLILIFIVIQIVNKVHLNRLDKKYKKLLRNSKAETIEDMIIDYGNRVEEILEYTRDVHSAYKGMDERISGCTQKVGMVRYKAFDDIGSNLSFSIALLDESDTGVVLTGIYGRSDSTTFAKPIDNGISKYDLSDEEKEAMEKAQKKFDYNNRYRMNDIDEINDVKEYGHSSKVEEYSEEYPEEYDGYDEAAYGDFEDNENLKG